MKIYDFTVLDTGKREVPLSDYKGKVLLIVNTATGCGLTPQYEGLESLYKKYKDQGFELLDFPCNQFLGQAPGTDEEIVSFCQTNYGTSFKTFSKINVNGDNAHPLFIYLKEQAPIDVENEESEAFKKLLSDLSQKTIGNDIKWNFTKFLVDRGGNIVGRFSPTVKPEELEKHIEKALNG